VRPRHTGTTLFNRRAVVHSGAGGPRRLCGRLIRPAAAWAPLDVRAQESPADPRLTGVGEVSPGVEEAFGGDLLTDGEAVDSVVGGLRPPPGAGRRRLSVAGAGGSSRWRHRGPA
jgi:hypothetical protein